MSPVTNVPQGRTPQFAQPQLPLVMQSVTIREMHQMREKYGNFPPYQRDRVWPQKYAQWLINTILSGRAIPSFSAYKESEQGRQSYWIVDGKQRFTAIMDFIDGKYPTWSEAQKERAEPNSTAPIEPHTFFKDLTPLARDYFLDYSVTFSIEPKINDAEQRGRFRAAQNQFPLSAAEKIASYTSKAKDAAELIKIHQFWPDFYFGADTNRGSIFQFSIYLIAIELSPDGMADLGGMSFLKTLASGRRDSEITDPLIETIFHRMEMMSILFAGLTFTIRPMVVAMYQAVKFVEDAGICITDEQHKGVLTDWAKGLIIENERPNNAIGYSRPMQQLVRKRIQKAFWEKHHPRVIALVR